MEERSFDLASTTTPPWAPGQRREEGAAPYVRGRKLIVDRDPEPEPFFAKKTDPLARRRAGQQDRKVPASTEHNGRWQSCEYFSQSIR